MTAMADRCKTSSVSSALSSRHSNQLASAVARGGGDAESARCSKTPHGEVGHGEAGPKGLSFYTAGFFIVAQLAGAGFVSLPAAMANTGWLGLPMMLLFCAMVGFAGTRLGYCWNILEERWPEDYIEPARQPYMEIAGRAYGKYGRNFALLCVFVAQYGGTTVFIILIAEMLNTLSGSLSTCEWVLVVGAVITPCTWFGSPKDFWLGPMLAVVATVLACLVIFVQTLLDAPEVGVVSHPNTSAASFALGFGSILFAYGGASVFPTIQNDMADRTQFWKSVVIGFVCILILYVPVSTSGYAVFGAEVDSNILFSVSQGVAVKLAMGLQIVNLLGSYVIGFSTLSQATEDILGIPTDFNFKRVINRTMLVWTEVLICLAIPDFSLILNLIGGSSITICTFILPPLMYLRLASTGPKHTQREVPLWMRIALIEIAIVGVVGGVLATVSSINEIVNTPFSSSCFMDFTPAADKRSLLDYVRYHPLVHGVWQK